MAVIENTEIKIDLASQSDDVDLQNDFWVINHCVLNSENRQLLIEAHSTQAIVTVSLLFWPGENTEFRCTAKVSAIAPKFRLDLQSETEIPSRSRSRRIPQES